MSLFVLDSSIALAWCFEDEASPAMDALLDRLETDEAAVPALWPYEMRNALLMGERRRRLDALRTGERLRFIGVLPIRVERMPPAGAADDALALARRHGLTAYDAAYLELAARLGVALATREADLRKAALDIGVACLP